MTKGKSTCKLLKDIRQQIADANGISYQPKECHYEGDCAGTCPACEAEIRYLEAQLRERKRKGWGMKVGWFGCWSLCCYGSAYIMSEHSQSLQR